MMTRWLSVFGFFVLGAASNALELRFLSFRWDGTIVWAVDQTNVYCGIQYADRLDSCWFAAPPPYWNMLITTPTNSARVPLEQIPTAQLFFRLVGSTNELPGGETYDVAALGIPRFASADYTELTKISRISRFRSGEGHDFSDDYESCRSMKHYFVPSPAVDWAGVRVFSPVNGVVECIRPDGKFGKQVLVRADDQPAFLFVLFHVNPTGSILSGSPVRAGQHLGTHWGVETSSDIAVRVATPGGEKLVSYFDVITDALFQAYQQRGVASRHDLIISKEERDADPLTCAGETFLDHGHLPGWVDLF